jgi:dimethylamine/trimethylamine dehydrogenase
MPKDSRPSRYDILFEPVRIGPKVAKNRFYQVPHCNGGGYRDPSAVVEMRRTKAEGGWGVIFTEQTEIHPTRKSPPSSNSASGTTATSPPWPGWPRR